MLVLKNVKPNWIYILKERKKLSLDSISYLINLFLLFFPTVLILLKFVNSLEIVSMVLKLWFLKIKNSLMKLLRHPLVFNPKITKISFSKKNSLPRDKLKSGVQSLNFKWEMFFINNLEKPKEPQNSGTKENHINLENTGLLIILHKSLFWLPPLFGLKMLPELSMTFNQDLKLLWKKLIKLLKEELLNLLIELEETFLS